MKIVFLDVDGVLNGHEWCHTGEGTRIKEVPARHLHLLLEKSKAKVVLISSWRAWVNHGHMTPNGFSKVLLSHGVRADVIDALGPKDPNLDHAPDRSEKINQWIEKHKPDNYVVLDDLKLSVANLIRPNPGVGLEPRHITEALKFLRA